MSRSPIAQLLRGALCTLLLLACGSGSNGDGNSSSWDGGSVQDAGTQLEDKALVLVINRPGDDNDGIAVMTQKADGSIVDNGVEIGGLVNPRYVAMNPSGTEAVVAWGLLAGDYGVSTLRFDADGKNASLVEHVKLGDTKNIFGISYFSEDKAVLSIASSMEHKLVALERSVEGSFDRVAESDVPNQWPLWTAADGEGGGYLMRGSFQDTANQIYTLESSSSAWAPLGQPASVMPRSLYIAARGDTVYTTVHDPEDQPTIDDPEEGGNLLVYKRQTNGDLVAQAPFDLPGFGTELALDPKGNFLVTADSVPEFFSGGVPNARRIRWVTVSLDEEGDPTQVAHGEVEHDTLIVHGIGINGNGHMATATELWDDQADDPDLPYLLQGWEQSGDDWVPVGAPIVLDGQPHIAVGM